MSCILLTEFRLYIHFGAFDNKAKASNFPHLQLHQNWTNIISIQNYLFTKISLYFSGKFDTDLVTTHNSYEKGHHNLTYRFNLNVQIWLWFGFLPFSWVLIGNFLYYWLPYLMVGILPARLLAISFSFDHM